MKLRLSGRPLLAVTLSAAVLAGCVSSVAIVPQPRAQKHQQPAAPVRGPDGSVSVPIGQPVRPAMPRPAGPIDPGFRRAQISSASCMEKEDRYVYLPVVAHP